MRRKLARRPSHGTIVAYIALFVALGGTAYAVDTIGSSDVINESLLSEDIKNLEIGTNDLALGAVFGSRIRDDGNLSSHVVNNTLTGSDIDESTLLEVNSAVRGRCKDEELSTVQGHLQSRRRRLASCATISDHRSREQHCPGSGAWTSEGI